MHWTPAKPEKHRSSRGIQWNEPSSELLMVLMNPIKLYPRSVHRITYKHEHELELSSPNRVVDFFSLSASIVEKKRENRFLPFLLKMFLIFLEKRRKGSNTKPKKKNPPRRRKQQNRHEKGTRKSFVRNSRFFWRSKRVEMSMRNLWRCRVRRLERKQLAGGRSTWIASHGIRLLQPRHAN